ncbi:alanyl-tRNA editing protein [Marinovum sp.]|uniref:alanyl-tRNA editing protein n=1 Tax=Marinovum sp. TaxID=2024839 RepID=UPI002B27A08B|nr:alanyl-tRNA editing protein [Marinovum sp.]
MTRLLFREDPYLREARAQVTGHTPEGGIILDRTVFYPTGGGQPGDSGLLVWDGVEMPIATTVKGAGTQVVLVPAEPRPLPARGAHVTQHLDWERRHRHMRVHTALHLLSVVVPLPVTGGAISSDKGRLDFDMPEAPADRDIIEEALQLLIERDLPVTETWVSDAVLEATPELVKTMSVKPPRGQGQVRLVRIGQGGDQVDLQPCGGTHVARTGEIGAIRLGKIEKKGRQNRRLNVILDS